MASDSKRSGPLPKAVDDGKLVETINSLDHASFCNLLLQDHDLEAACDKFAHDTGRAASFTLLFPKALFSHENHAFEACFNLIQDSSAADYKASEMKWSLPRKQKEMMLPDMRYLVLFETPKDPLSKSGAVDSCEQQCGVSGFVSFMITYEDGYEVIYIYEIHLVASLRRQGVGTTLMTLVEDIGRKAGVEKCMLTVFKSNKSAVKWYERCGYSIDDFSPGPRVLRNGTIKTPTYLILSKTLRSSVSNG